MHKRGPLDSIDAVIGGLVESVNQLNARLDRHDQAHDELAKIRTTGNAELRASVAQIHASHEAMQAALADISIRLEQRLTTIEVTVAAVRWSLGSLAAALVLVVASSTNLIGSMWQALTGMGHGPKPGGG